MRYLLDTNICIYLIKKRPPQVVDKIKTISGHHMAISSITLSELEYGIAKSDRTKQARAALDTFISDITVLPFDENAAKYYGETRAYLAIKGTPIGPLDTLIAAHALSLDLILVTNNGREFKRIQNLKVENWAE